MAPVPDGYGKPRYYDTRLLLNNNHGESQGIVIPIISLFRFPVRVEYKIETSSNCIANGASAIVMLMSGAPSTTKCTVAPESAIANSTCLATLLVLNMASACGSFVYYMASTIFAHA